MYPVTEEEVVAFHRMPQHVGSAIHLLTVALLPFTKEKNRMMFVASTNLAQPTIFDLSDDPFILPT